VVQQQEGRQRKKRKKSLAAFSLEIDVREQHIRIFSTLDQHISVDQVLHFAGQHFEPAISTTQLLHNQTNPHKTVKQIITQDSQTYLMVSRNQ
jgi:hypothetical protein